MNPTPRDVKTTDVSCGVIQRSRCAEIDLNACIAKREGRCARDREVDVKSLWMFFSFPSLPFWRYIASQWVQWRLLLTTSSVCFWTAPCAWKPQWWDTESEARLRSVALISRPRSLEWQMRNERRKGLRNRNFKCGNILLQKSWRQQRGLPPAKSFFSCPTTNRFFAPSSLQKKFRLRPIQRQRGWTWTRSFSVLCLNKS